jgi:TnpA family transposase
LQNSSQNALVLHDSFANENTNKFTHPGDLAELLSFANARPWVMPVDFLSDEQADRYGHYTGDPSAAQMARYFYLDDADRAEVFIRRGDHNRLGYALQLCTVRFLGTFLSNPIDVPAVVIQHLASQLSIANPESAKQYLERPATHREHAGEIQHHHGYQDFSHQPQHFRLARWLYSRAWMSAERPSVLFDLTTARMVERKILLPGVTVLTRLIARIRDRAATRLWRCLAGLPSQEQQARLETLIVVPEGDRVSPLDRLRRGPTRISSPAMVGALERLEEIRSLNINRLDLSRLPAGRIYTLARHAAAMWATNIARMPPQRRIATLVAFAHVFEIVAQDDALDLLDQLITQCLARAESAGEKERLRTIRDLDAAAIRLSEIGKIVVNWNLKDRIVRRTAFQAVPASQIEQDIATVTRLTRTPDDNYYEFLLGNYSTIRRFLPELLRTIHFEGARAGQPVLRAVEFLQGIEGRSKPNMKEAPREIVNRGWSRLVFEQDDKIDRRFYTFCVLERLQDSLTRRDVWVNPSERWGNPRAKLLAGAHWEAARPQVCRTLDLPQSPEPALETLTTQLDTAYRAVLDNLDQNPDLRIEHVKGKRRLSLTGLDKLEEPDSLVEVRQRVNRLLPHVDLTDAILEIHGHTGFADEFTHISEGNSRVDNLPLSICAVLAAEACNIGIEPFVDPANPALTHGRLSWVQQNYIRAETLTRANARLVDAQSRIPLAKAFGGGEVASADGLRFVVPVRTLNAGPNSKYFHVERGVTYYNFTSDQFTGFHGIVIPGTLGDSPYVLDGLLEHQTSLNPKELMTDTAGYSDVVFGMFWLLGFQFSPRLADLGDARFWRIDRKADYGAFNEIARHRINIKLIIQNWDDLLRVAGSLKMGLVRPSELIRVLQRGSKRSMLARAIGELGRIPKTLHLLTFINDPSYRRRILTQLNRGEGRHRLARKCFHGQRGELRQRYREGQEDQLGALGLVLNALILWNTRYMDAALNLLRSQGIEVKAEDVARLSPLGDSHINVQGRYHFTITDAVLRGDLRPLRNPDETEDLLRSEIA